MTNTTTIQDVTFTDEPTPLPWCAYPTATQVAQHGVLALPETLPLTNLGAVGVYRSRQFKAVPANSLTNTQVLQMARVVAASFAQREPMMRHVRPPLLAPAGLDTVIHTDPFGSAHFGPWTRENILYWFVRLFVLTDPTSPLRAIAINNDALSQSMAIVNPSGQIIGGAFNETMPPIDVEPDFRQNDPFLEAVVPYLEPALTLLGGQDLEAITALSNQFSDFKTAFEEDRVGHHFMVARTDDLSKSDTFELVAASVIRYQELDYKYMLIEASNQWTGAACELLGGVRVHHAPYQVDHVVQESAVAIEGMVSSSNGFISAKDSGCMFYVIRLG